MLWHVPAPSSMGGTVPEAIKRGVAYLVLGFLFFYLVTQPEAFAAVVRSLVAALGEAFQALMRFFEALAP